MPVMLGCFGIALQQRAKDSLRMETFAATGSPIRVSREEIGIALKQHHRARDGIGIGWIAGEHSISSHFHRGRNGGGDRRTSARERLDKRHSEAFE